jgi:aldose 1-epimerase
VTPAYSIESGESEGYATWTLSSKKADLHATFAPPAGMVGCSLRHAGEELLHLGGGVAEYARTGSTIGIPLLHPWANRLAGFEYSAAGRTVKLDASSPLLSLDENGLPIHGLLGGSPHWRVRTTTADGEGATLSAELDFGAHDDLLAAFPFPHLLRTDVRLEESALTIRTTVRATSDVEVPVSFGYHPYLRLPGAPREEWEIELPVRQQLVLDDRMIPTGRTEPVRFPRQPLGNRAFDDAFGELEPGRSFVAAAAGRELAVTFLKGYPFAQVYSPSGEQFICYEPMTAATNALSVGGPALPTVRPSDSFSAAFRISVR